MRQRPEKQRGNHPERRSDHRAEYEQRPIERDRTDAGGHRHLFAQKRYAQSVAEDCPDKAQLPHRFRSQAQRQHMRKRDLALAIREREAPCPGLHDVCQSAQRDYQRQPPSQTIDVSRELVHVRSVNQPAQQTKSSDCGNGARSVTTHKRPLSLRFRRRSTNRREHPRT